MLLPAAMYRVELALLSSEAPAVALKLAQFGFFAPAQTDEHRLPEQPMNQLGQLYEQARSRLQKILDFYAYEAKIDSTLCDQVSDESDLQSLNQWLAQLWQQCSEEAERLRQYQERLEEIRQLKQSLRHYQSLDIDLKLLQRDFRFLHLQVGTVHRADVQRLRQAIAMIGYTLTEFSHQDELAYIVLAGLKEQADKLQSVLQAANFRALNLPQEFIGHPQKIAQMLDEEQQQVLSQKQALQDEIQQRLQAQKKDLDQALSRLLTVAALVQLKVAMSSQGGLARIVGWVPQNRLADLQKKLAELEQPVLLEYEKPQPEIMNQVPSYIHHPAWLKPFTALVKNYGIPRYQEIDPTWFFVVSFVLMFGMMFGDVGQGALIFAAGFLFKDQWRFMRPFFFAIGTSSMIFGWIYGSLFGYEHLLPPLWMSPLHDPILMLKLAFIWGVSFILFGTLMRIRNDWVMGHYQQALFQPQGLAGLLLYLGLLFSLYALSQGQSLGLIHQAAILIPLAIILLHAWQHIEAPLGEKLLVTLIEGFEALMNYISNTLSFMRVAAFSLNHVALAIAVFTLANMMDSFGHWTTVVLGNLFILVIEAAIVIIQILRLEYYEGFSRFFYGDGHLFQPIRLHKYLIIKNTY